MKKLLYILLFFPLALFGQNDCELPKHYSGIGSGTMHLIFGQEFISSLNLISPNPYIVAITSSGLVVGSAGLAPNLLQNGMQQLTLWGDDSYTNNVIEGANEGETIYFQIVDGIYLYEINNLSNSAWIPLNNISFYTNDIIVINAGQSVYQCSAQVITGCTNIFADNYNLESNTDDGSCYYLGCTDSTSLNFNSSATVDNGSCIEIVYGCTDITAFNFDLQANVEDGSCVTLEEYIIDSLQTELEELNQEATTSLSSLQQALDTWNTTIDLSSGWNMFGYGCPTSIDVAEGLSNHTESIIITKDNNGNVHMPEFGFNGIGGFTPGFGYQIKLTEAIEGFSLCDWYVNDIPEDNIVSLQDSLDLINSQIGCTDSLACNYDGYNLYDDGSCHYPEQGYDCDGNIAADIGDIIEGGYLFYVDETGQHGLIAAMEDLPGTYEWGCNGEFVSGSDGTSIGTGFQNTIDIVNQGCISVFGLTAAQATLGAQINNYHDWYLPSKDELIEMYSTIGNGGAEGNVGGFVLNVYMSSSEYSINSIWVVGLDNGFSGPTPKTELGRVRPIRSF